MRELDTAYFELGAKFVQYTVICVEAYGVRKRSEGGCKIAAFVWVTAGSESNFLTLVSLNPVSYTHLTLPTKRIV